MSGGVLGSQVISVVNCGGLMGENGRLLRVGSQIFPTIFASLSWGIVEYCQIWVVLVVESGGKWGSVDSVGG